MYISNNGFSNLFPSPYMNFQAPDIILSRAEVLCLTGVHLTDSFMVHTFGVTPKSHCQTQRY